MRCCQGARNVGGGAACHVWGAGRRKLPEMTWRCGSGAVGVSTPQLPLLGLILGVGIACERFYRQCRLCLNLIQLGKLSAVACFMHSALLSPFRLAPFHGVMNHRRTVDRPFDQAPTHAKNSQDDG